ncbi:MAG TPA: phage holin family protein [Noviherbaspirillum sp.]|jgi:divalent metal cation (Fe/Co/Zn/Cd) transporter|uniref:phage holin family protein n=1 Tax=Noviherbaspirillum sp. TaxID=1926288 RepID=UPI002DDCB80D|nr:phage holin family protein [Noviherbaspirillum sp.]HEV2610524.1 phage holin family protein [Noviherbaspirillum sp.]
METDKNGKSLPALFSDLTHEMVDLVRQEIALARAEMSQKVSTATTAITAVAIGAAVALAGLFIILQAVVKGVEMLLPQEVAPWLAPLLVGLVFAVIGYLMLRGGTAKLKPDNLMPHRTMDSLRRDKGLVKEKAQ